MKLIDLKQFIETTPLIVHSAQMEAKWFLANGINPNIQFDTRIEARLFDERLPADLNSLVLRFNLDKYYKLGDVTALEGEALAQRPTRDARNTLALHNYLYPKLTEAEKKVYQEVLVPAAKTLAQIELEGVCVDTELITKLQTELSSDIAKLNLGRDKSVKEFEQAHGGRIKGGKFNVGSPQQKQILIYDFLGYPVIQTTDKGAPSTEAEVVEALLKLKHIEQGHAGEVEECKACQKTTLSKVDKASKWTGWRDKFLAQMLRHVVIIGGKAFLFTDLVGEAAATGRVASSNPNLQNAPKGKVRRIFIPRYRYLVEFDYKGIEWRIWICLAKDESLIDAVLHDDPHTATARDIFQKKNISKDERFIAKTMNFTLINGGGPFRLTLVTGLPLDTTKQMFKRFWREHPAGKVFWEQYVEEIESYDEWGKPQSGIIRSCTGMKRHFNAPTEARNHLIQNPALVALFAGANEAVPFIKASGKGVADLLVHDSLRVDSKTIDKRFLRKIKEIMEAQTLIINGEKMVVPLEVEAKYGANWYEMTEVKL